VRRGPISTGTATVCAIIIATVLMTVVAAGLLVPGEETGAAGLLVPGEETGAAGQVLTLPVEAVTGYADAPAIRISGTESAINLTGCRIYLIDPEGTLRDVETAILENATLGAGQAVYIFHLPRDDRPAASGYWITDEPDMIFTAACHPGIRPFSPGGQWRIVVYDTNSMKNRIDQVVLINGPASPG
jgi:hypothetical protein